MEKRILLWMVAILTLCSCSTSDNIYDPISLSKVSHSDCGNHIRTRGEYAPKLKLTYNKASKTITGEYINYTLNCDYTNAGINIDHDVDGALVLNPWNDGEGKANCICHINIYFTIHNATMPRYHLILNRQKVIIHEGDGSIREEIWTDYDGVISFSTQNTITINL